MDDDGDDLGWTSVTFTPPIPDELDDTWKSSNRKRAAVNSMTLRFPTQPKDYRQLSVADLDFCGPLGMIIADCVYQKDAGGTMGDDNLPQNSWNKVPCKRAEFLEFCTKYVIYAKEKGVGTEAPAAMYHTSAQSLCIVFFGGFLQVITFSCIVGQLMKLLGCGAGQ